MSSCRWETLMAGAALESQLSKGVAGNLPNEGSSVIPSCQEEC